MGQGRPLPGRPAPDRPGCGAWSSKGHNRLTATIFTVLLGFLVAEHARRPQDPARSEDVARSVRERFGSVIAPDQNGAVALEGASVRSRSQAPSLGGEVMALAEASFEPNPRLEFTADDLFDGETAATRGAVGLRIRRLATEILADPKDVVVVRAPAAGAEAGLVSDRLGGVVDLLTRLGLPEDRIEVALAPHSTEIWSIESRSVR